jgi:UDP:flavonoid glycosyltransferase YjiC (YdhE family)
VSVSPSPLLWGNPNDALVMQPLRSPNPSRLGVRVDLAVGGFVLRWALDPALNRMRRELGLPPLRGNLSRGATQADLNLGIWSPLLRGPLEGDPNNACITGFTWHDRDHTQETPDAELQAFLNAGEPPIVFALGSTGVHAPGAFFEHAVKVVLNRCRNSHGCAKNQST